MKRYVTIILAVLLTLTGCAESSGTVSETNASDNSVDLSSVTSETSGSDTSEEEIASENGVSTISVSFENEDSGLNLSGILFLPDGFDETNQYAAVVVTGPMLSVKEQAQSIYAERLAENGFVTLVFDYSYFGESEGEPRQLEEPDIKASDISSAVSYLQSLDYVDSENIGGLGICGSGSYMPYAAIQDERIKAVTSVVPATTMSSMIMMSTEQAEADRESYESGEADPTYIDLMPRAYAEGAAYYYNEERGYRDNWDNHAVSWSELSWIDFHPEEFISELEAPYLIITGENAWSRSGAEQLYENTTSEKEFYVIEDAGHFDMYDLEPYVTEALDYIVPFFESHLNTGA
ncbi:MAG: alpha/beta hydrolase [Oscillospiraceae bacterium]|nr:alpha/beta hydrolase [Oscillospiraceae bacterium]